MTSEAFPEVPFGSVVEFSLGGGWGKDEAADGFLPVRVIRGTDFTSLERGRVSDVPARWEKATSVERRLLRQNDILLEISGGSPRSGQTTGRSLLVTERHLALLGNAIPASFCRLMRVDKDRAFPQYVAYYLKWLHASGQAGRFENQSTGISNFQFKYFCSEGQISTFGVLGGGQS